MRPSRLALTTLITVAVLSTASGCFMLPSAPTTTSAPAPVTSESTTPEEPVDDEESAAPAEPATGDLTAPGTELSFGDVATISFDYGTDTVAQPLDIVVSGVTEGSIADFEAAGVEQDFIDDLAGYTVYYINVELTKGAGATTELAYTSVTSNMDLLDANGNTGSSVTIFGDFAPCNDESMDASIDEGATVSNCFMSALPNDVEPGSVVYNAYDSVYDSLDGNPIVWS